MTPFSTIMFASVFNVTGALNGIGSLWYLRSTLFAFESTLESLKMKVISIFFHLILLSGMKRNYNHHVFMSNGYRGSIRVLFSAKPNQLYYNTVREYRLGISPPYCMLSLQCSDTLHTLDSIHSKINFTNRKNSTFSRKLVIYRMLLCVGQSSFKYFRVPVCLTSFIIDFS